MLIIMKVLWFELKPKHQTNDLACLEFTGIDAVKNLRSGWLMERSKFASSITS